MAVIVFEDDEEGVDFPLLLFPLSQRGFVGGRPTPLDFSR